MVIPSGRGCMVAFYTSAQHDHLCCWFAALTVCRSIVNSIEYSVKNDIRQSSWCLGKRHYESEASWQLV